ncbi:MAG: ABC transporter ATP-binding protein [Candidatus Pelethousia sp.]|nr:ABC transporter ATP-binding protein [Candidatus Pelethousia sp.]
MKLILCYIRRHMGMFLTALLFLTLETFADLLQPALMAHIVDNGVKVHNVNLILRYGAIMIGIAAAGAAMAVLRCIYASRTSQLIGKELRSDLYQKVQSLSFENIDRLQPASIITRITNDVTQIQNFINGIMRIMMKVPIICVGAVALIIVQTPKQFPVMAGILLLCGLLIAINMRLGYPLYGKLQHKLDRLNDVSREFFSSIRVVKAFHAEEQEEEKFGAAATGFAMAGVSAMRVLAVFSPLINLVVNTGIILLLWLSQAQDAEQIGRLMASINYMTQVLFAMGMVSIILNNAVRAIASSERVQEILNERPVQALAPHPLSSEITGRISFQNVSFSYAGSSEAAVRHLTFTVEPGETIGIIGPTGSGKTSLISLVPRFYDATAGQVQLDGKDVRQLDTIALRQSIAVVPQKSLLFSGTIAENLRWGKEDATEEEMLDAARSACADIFVNSFPEGYHTQLGQGGVNLSGGQKQRLSIARALLRRPRILILDDCTSALDASTEAAVLKGLREKMAGITVLLISQRISTVMRADKILCMEDGRLQGFGSHQKLMERCDAYRAIYASQIGGIRIG